MTCKLKRLRGTRLGFQRFTGWFHRPWSVRWWHLSHTQHSDLLLCPLSVHVLSSPDPPRSQGWHTLRRDVHNCGPQAKRTSREKWNKSSFRKQERCWSSGRALVGIERSPRRSPRREVPMPSKRRLTAHSTVGSSRPARASSSSSPPPPRRLYPSTCPTAPPPAAAPPPPPPSLGPPGPS